MSEQTSHIGIYRSGLTSPEHRRHITVGRQAILDDTLELLHGSANRRSKHHFLFIGPRGIGKTHLLSLIEDTVKEDASRFADYIVARFPEESNRTLSFADFLLELCEILRDVLPEEPAWGEIYTRLETEEDNAVIVDTVVPEIRRQNRDRHRTVLVMIENLAEIFTRQIKNRNDIAALRKFFMEPNGCLLLGTAPLHFNSITDVGQPFYDFFDVQVLDNLTEAQTLRLIHRNLEWEERTDLLADFEAMRPRLLALYRMTGGSPRLTVMLYELIAHDSITKVQEQFRVLLDRITPFYQDRLSDLPPQERALLETMAKMRDQDKTPGAMAAHMRMKQPQTSALLKRLTQARYLKVSPVPGDKRSRRYTIREGFFDIWLAMNLSRGARKRLPFLLDFFSAFYPSFEERERKRDELRKKLQAESDAADAKDTLSYLSEVGDEKEREAAKLDLARLYVREGDPAEAMTYVREASTLTPDPIGGWITEHIGAAAPDYLSELESMVECWDLHRSGNLEAFAAKLRDMGGTLTLKSFSEVKLDFLRDHLDRLADARTRILLRLSIARLLDELARWGEAESQLRDARGEAEALNDSKLVAVVLNNLAQILQDTNRIDEAEPLMRRALDIDEAAHGGDHPTVAIQLNNLAALLQATNRIGEAEPLMRRALDIDEAARGGDHPTVAIRLNNLALVLKDTSRLDEAEPLMRRALEIGEAAYGRDHPTVATRLNNLAQILQATNRIDEAEPLMRRALDIDEAAYGTDHPKVAVDLSTLAQILEDTDRLDEAEPLMRRALEIDEAAYGSDHPTVATCLNNLSRLLQDTNRIDEAEPLMRRALDIFIAFTRKTGCLHPRLAAAIKNYSVMLRERGQGSDGGRTVNPMSIVPDDLKPLLAGKLD